jgi:hypothetical protein
MLDLFVLVTGRDYEAIALLMSLVVFCKRQIEGLRAAVLAALADDLDSSPPGTSPRFVKRDRGEHHGYGGGALQCRIVHIE